LVGAAGVSAVPDSARVVQMVGQQEDPHNFLLMHAMAPNVAGVIGSAVAAGVLWAVLAPSVEVIDLIDAEPVVQEVATMIDSTSTERHTMKNTEMKNTEQSDKAAFVRPN